VKITKSYLKRVIKEEVARILHEQPGEETSSYPLTHAEPGARSSTQSLESTPETDLLQILKSLTVAGPAFTNHDYDTFARDIVQVVNGDWQMMQDVLAKAYDHSGRRGNVILQKQLNAIEPLIKVKDSSFAGFGLPGKDAGHGSPWSHKAGQDRSV
tara:strand:- start:728 stop:1195 length:468 start_codon:yes stop_codon:yes gene_type:complete